MSPLRILLLIPIAYMGAASAMNYANFRRSGDIEDRRSENESQATSALTNLEAQRDYLIKIGDILRNHPAILNCPQLKYSKKDLLDITDKIKQQKTVPKDIPTEDAYNELIRNYDGLALNAFMIHDDIFDRSPGVYNTDNPGSLWTCKNISIAISNSLRNFSHNYRIASEYYRLQFKAAKTPPLSPIDPLPPDWSGDDSNQATR